jgi:Tol biopolymer transport system component
MKSKMRILLGFVFWSSCWMVIASEKENGQLGHSTLLEMESVSSPMISPDGAQIVFSRRWVDKKKDRFASNLWLVDTGGERVRELTHGSWRDSSPVWAPHGGKIAFISDRDGTSQIHVLWVDSGEVAQLTHLDRTPGSLAWSHDGKQLAFTSFVDDVKPILPIKLPKKPKGAEWAKPATVIDRLNWRRDGRGRLPKGFTHVYTLDAVLGGTPRKVTAGDYNHSAPQWAPDGKTIYFSGIRKPDAAYLRNDSEIYSVDLGTLEVRTLTDRKGPDRGPVVSPDGKWIAYQGYEFHQPSVQSVSDGYHWW